MSDLPDWHEHVRLLAALPPFEYEQQRKEAAQQLGCRIQTLDEAVRKARAGTNTEPAGRTFELPEVELWPEPVDGEALLNRLANVFDTHSSLPPYASTVLALWTLLTYVFDKFDICPMLLLSSPEKGCGKTTVLSLLGRLVHKPLLTSNISPAALYRSVEKWQPTLLIDEVDTFLRRDQELRGIINSGHTRDAAFIVRTVTDEHEPRRFSTWCPKALAGIGKVPGTIEDRSLRLTLQRKRPGERIARLRQVSFEVECRQCVRWAQDHGDGSLCRQPSHVPDFLDNRAADNWEPLFALAAQAASHWLERCQRAASALTGADQGESVSYELLRDIRTAFVESGENRLPTGRLLTRLAAEPESPWSGFSQGKCMTDRQLASRLRLYGILSKTIRLSDGHTLKGYELAQFEEAFSRYLPELSVTASQQRKNIALEQPSIRHNGHPVTDDNPSKSTNTSRL